MKTIIFLDIDGVLANDEMYNRPRSNQFSIYPFHPDCVSVYNSILNEYDIDYVISSDWRKHFDFQTLLDIFEWNKVVKAPIGTTALFADGQKMSTSLEHARLLQIKDYVKKNNLTDKAWFAIDDMDLSALNEANITRFVLSDPIEGIMTKGIKEIIDETIKKFGN